MKIDKITLSRNLAFLRQTNKYSQEGLAEKIGVTRQSIAKWENGESLPDIINCDALAKLFNVSLDDLLHYDQQENKLSIPPKGKHFFGSIIVEERGNIQIPDEALKTLNISSGDKLVLLGDENPERFGLALVPITFFTSVHQMITENKEEKNDE